jgi:hypothetical protein
MNQHYVMVIQAHFEAEKNKKAFMYTVIICGVLLLLFFIITWPILEVKQPVALDLIEINLGNNEEGFGETQPLIKGEMSPTQESAATPPPQATASKADAAEDPQPDDNAEEDAAPVTKSVAIKPVVKPKDVVVPSITKTVKVKTPTPAVAAVPKPQKPIATYKGPGNGRGNGATEDNGYRNQGKNPGGKGDAGDPSGKPDSYGKIPGGRSGGPKVIGNRKIIKYYSFTGDLDKATINAIVKVSPAGIGTFTGFGKGSSTRGQEYANAIINYLRNVKFDAASEESTVTVQFNFNVN